MEYKYVSRSYLIEKLNVLKINMNYLEHACDRNLTDEVDKETLAKVKDDMIYAAKAIIAELGE